jgi:4-oxalocrotonate tautomerase
MPTIIVEWLETRSQEQKRELVDKITPIVAECAGVKIESVIVKFREDTLDGWAKGGRFGSDMYPNFRNENK